jgi:L-rhamnonate dehydratase
MPIAWDSTTIIVVELDAGACRGIGYSYGDRAAASIAGHVLAPHVVGRRADQPAAIFAELNAIVRNMGKPGVASAAISAVDVAVWDLRAKLLGVPLASLLGWARDAVTVYGSGGFTSYDDHELVDQLAGWAADGTGSSIGGRGSRA